VSISLSPPPTDLYVFVLAMLSVYHTSSSSTDLLGGLESVAIPICSEFLIRNKRRWLCQGRDIGFN
jgi:hypothetical protein